MVLPAASAPQGEIGPICRGKGCSRITDEALEQDGDVETSVNGPGDASEAPMRMVKGVAAEQLAKMLRSPHDVANLRLFPIC